MDPRSFPLDLSPDQMRARAWFYWRAADTVDNEAARAEQIRLAEQYEEIAEASERGADLLELWPEGMR
jgi:hypothetical protein